MTSLTMPASTKILLCQAKDKYVLLCGLCDPYAGLIRRTFHLVTAGDVVDEHEVYVASVHTDSMTWHIFERLEDTDGSADSRY